MVSSEGLIYNIKVSSIGPASVTGPGLISEPANIDLAMKLHYIRGIYYFRSQAFEGLTTLAIKEPMFTWLNKYPVTCGRFTRAESGRAHIKCNDCGVRFIEAKCDKTLDEWLDMEDNIATLEKLLAPNKVIGPELGFSPLVFIQLTKFKCGGTALGLSWAHVLGDAFSAAEYINMLGRVVAGHDLGRPINLAHIDKKPITPNSLTKVVAEDPLSVKRVDPVGDNWVHVTKCKIEPFSFNVPPTQLSNLQSKLSQNGSFVAPFEAIAAMIWQSIARIRGKECEPNVVTICKRSEDHNKAYGALGNYSQVVSVVKVDFPLVEADTSELASLVQNATFDERKKIEDAMERDHRLSDFIVYGANLTFVNLEEVEFYEFEYREEKPVRVSYRIDGVGDQGAVLVLPGPKDGGEKGGGRMVVAMLPENEIVGLKSELNVAGLMG